jgi:hypothetical protein
MSAPDTTGWICPQHPFGHQWDAGLRCSLCGAERSAAEAIVSGLNSARGWNDACAERALAAHRAEVLAEAKAETVAWLVKKAREYRSTGSQQHALQADAISMLTDKVNQGAIRIFLHAERKNTEAGGSR